MILRAIFEEDKILTNKVRFREIVQNSYAAPLIGSIDVPKSTLERVGWKSGQLFEIDLGKTSSSRSRFTDVLRTPTFDELNDDYTDPN